MSFWDRLKKRLAWDENAQAELAPGVSQGEKDTLSVIQDLSRLVMNNPDAVDLYLALGNLYRAKGDVERAVQIRESLLVRQELAAPFRARAYFELGQDYRRAGLMDRAFTAYQEAGRLGFPGQNINNELAGLFADTGNWEKAVAYFSAIGNRQAEAHYLVRQAMELPKDAHGKALRLINRALKVYPPSPEAWSALIRMYARAENWAGAAKMLGKALERIPAPQQFMVLEELMGLAAPERENYQEFDRAMGESFLPVLEKRPPELGPYYYGALILRRCGRLEEAAAWLAKALVIEPKFWDGRLALLELALKQYSLPPMVETQLRYFLEQAKSFKHFACKACGLHRAQLFHVCQRCHSWHSAVLKITFDQTPVDPRPHEK